MKAVKMFHCVFLKKKRIGRTKNETMQDDLQTKQHPDQACQRLSSKICFMGFPAVTY